MRTPPAFPDRSTARCRSCCCSHVYFDSPETLVVSFLRRSTCRLHKRKPRNPDKYLERQKCRVPVDLAYIVKGEYLLSKFPAGPYASRNDTVLTNVSNFVFSFFVFLVALSTFLTPG